MVKKSSQSAVICDSTLNTPPISSTYLPYPKELNMRSKIKAQLSILSFFILLFCPDVSTFAQHSEEVLVRVNEASITRRDLQIEMALLDAEMAKRNHTLSKHQMAKLSRKLVENLIQRELLYQEAQQKKIKIQKRWVDKALTDFKAKLRTKGGLRHYLQKATLNETQLKTRIEKGLIVRRLLRRDVIRQIKVSEAEMQAFYRKNPEFFQKREQIRVRQIMMSVDAAGGTSKRGNALERMQAVQNKIVGGANFAALALEYSEDNTKTSGGDLGYLDRGQLIKPLADAAANLRAGEVSEIIESRLGFHLIQLVDRIPSSQMAYRNARTKIERTIRRNKENAAADAYMAVLKRQAAIKRFVRP
jgi:parvulin-like peptidyl-prolyl isomerase